MIPHYIQRINDSENLIVKLKQRDNVFNLARLLSFLALIVAFIFSITTGNVIAILFTVVFLFAFINIVLRDLNNLSELEREKTRKEILENEIACLSLQGSAYYNGSIFIDPEHDYTNDMDVFGKKSLYHYLNRCATGVGNKALGQWLGKIYHKEEILLRQKAVKELADKQPWCEDIRVDVYNRRITDFTKEHLPSIEKAILPPAQIGLLITTSYVLFASSIIASIWIGTGVLLLIPVLFNILVNGRLLKFTRAIRAQLEGRERTLNDYNKILTSFENMNFSSDYLRELQSLLKLENTNATQAIENLRKLSRKLDYSLHMLTGAFLNLVFLWDIIICTRISRWFDNYADKTTEWFAVVGKLEALISLANLQNNHPKWVYPVFADAGAFFFEGHNLGHPLIPENERVNNDFSLQGEALMNIITGSNMAGKSTFLRTIGVNTILAKTGSVACAHRLTLSWFRIMTYLTITDSLAENTSTFYREIKRLKKILDSARQDNNMLLLLDELLRGTNSADKARGSIAITGELIRYRVPSLIATHSLELAAMDKVYPDKITNYFFDIVIDQNNTMRFDYKLKPGICNTFNASILLKEIGIDI